MDPNPLAAVDIPLIGLEGITALVEALYGAGNRGRSGSSHRDAAGEGAAHTAGPSPTGGQLGQAAVAALLENTAALQRLTSLLGPANGPGLAPGDGADGTGSGMRAAGIGGGLLRRQSAVPAQIGAQFPALAPAAAAYSVASDSAAHGVTLGNLLGAWSAGSAIGGPLGGAVGIGVDLLGSLFHHRSRPQRPQQSNYPSIYDSPADFDYMAYRYRATGALPAASSSWQNPLGAAPVQVHFYTDGVQRSVQEVTAASTSLAKTALGNGYYDGRRPI